MHTQCVASKKPISGQKLSKSHESELEGLPADAAWHQKVLIKYRRLIGVLIPFIIYNLVWWSLAIKHNYFAYFPDRYYLSITMIFGAMIGGATSEGGGAVAFPVMTLALGIPPAIARDFSMMCQSCGKVTIASSLRYTNPIKNTLFTRSKERNMWVCVISWEL